MPKAHRKSSSEQKEQEKKSVSASRSNVERISEKDRGTSKNSEDHSQSGFSEQEDRRIQQSGSIDYGKE